MKKWLSLLIESAKTKVWLTSERTLLFSGLTAPALAVHRKPHHGGRSSILINEKFYRMAKTGHKKKALSGLVKHELAHGILKHKGYRGIEKGREYWRQEDEADSYMTPVEYRSMMALRREYRRDYFQRKRRRAFIRHNRRKSSIRRGVKAHGPH